MGRPLKFIFLPLGYLLAHVGRLTRIARELRERGHEIVFGGENPEEDSRSKLGLAKAEGFRLVYAREADYPYAWNRFEKYGYMATAWDLLRHQHWAPLDTILEGHIELFRREKPDMVVGDGTISASTAVYICGIPVAGVMNSYNHWFLSGRNVCTPVIRAWDKLYLARIRGRTYRKYGVKPVDALRLLRHIPMISPDLPGFFPQPIGWPNWHTVGPILFEPPARLPPWFDELDDGTPNIYLTMGSTGLLNGVLRRTFDALGRTPFRFLLTTGGQVGDEVLAHAPSNFRVSTYAPGSALAKKSKALIFHGGNGTMYQGLAAGIPMIALPSHLEQELNFRCALQKGFGIQLHARRVTGKQLVAALHRILEVSEYRRASEGLSEAVRSSNGAATAADLLEACARSGVPAGHGLA